MSQTLKPHMIITCGKPGKNSAWALKQVSDDRTGRTVRVCRADIRFERFGHYVLKDQKDEDCVTGIETKRVIEALRAGKVVIIDDLSLNGPGRSKWQQIAATHGASFELVDIENPPSSSNRKKKHKASKENADSSKNFFERMAENFFRTTSRQ